MSSPDAFIAVSNLYAKSRLLYGILTDEHEIVAKCFSAFEGRLGKLCPVTSGRLWESGVSADFYLAEWLTSLFTHCLCLETLWYHLHSRAWDVLFVEGDESLLKVALALVLSWEDRGDSSVQDFVQTVVTQHSRSLSAETLFLYLRRVKVKLYF